MNEFTKDELSDVLFALEQWGHPMCDYPKYTYIRNKLRIMIDNYCEHKWDNSCCGCPMDYISCEKCGKYII